MAKVAIGLCIVEFSLPGITSLKEKRSILKRMLSRVRKTFNVSVAEVDDQDLLDSAVVALTVVSNSATHNQRSLQSIVDWIEDNIHDLQVVQFHMEMI